jgi:superfamily II DNA or RNA helicase
MNKTSAFHLLKAQKKTYNTTVTTGKRPHNSGAKSTFSFQLREDGFGYYIVTCNQQNQPLLVDEHYYQGAVHQALALYNRLSGSVSWKITWGKPDDRLYLSEHPDLFESILDCSSHLTLHNARQPVRFNPGSGTIVLKTQKLDDLSTLTCSVTYQLRKKGDSHPYPHPYSHPQTQPHPHPQTDSHPQQHPFIFLTPSLILANREIYRTEPAAHYEQLDLFNCTIREEEAGDLFSLFLSNFPGAELEHNDYTVQHLNRIAPQPSLILEHIDSSKALHLTIACSAPEIELDFLNSYDLSSLVVIDNEQHSLNIHSVSPCDITRPIEIIEKTLKIHQHKSDPQCTFTRLDNLFIIQPKLALVFLETELHTILSSFILIGTKELEKFRIRMMKPTLNLRIGSGIDFLEGSADIDMGTEVFKLADFLSQYDKNRYIMLSDGTKAVVEHKFISRLKRFLKPGKDGNLSISFFDLPLIAELIDEKTADSGFLKSRSILEGFNTFGQIDVPEPLLQGTLRDYQHIGYKWLRYLHTHSLGGCLADDMGLGKTIQTIALMSTAYPGGSGNSGKEQPSIIVMPKSILLNWLREIGRFAPQLTACIYHGSDRNLAESLKYQLILTTYATVRNDIEALTQQDFFYIILDESQRIKNIDSQISKAVMLLQGRMRLALSGTPVENNLAELYALFRFLNPTMFRSRKQFQKEYFDPITRKGDEQALSDLKKKIYPFMLRRLKSEVLQQLPDKTEQIIYVEMSASQKKLYETRRRFYHEAIRMQIASDGFNKARFFLFQAMNELRQIASIPEHMSAALGSMGSMGSTAISSTSVHTNVADTVAVDTVAVDTVAVDTADTSGTADTTITSPKVSILGEYLEETVGNNHKALVFANYLEALNLIEDELDKRHITYLKMTGKTRNRAAIVDAFQESDEYQVLLMTLKTGGVGLNLTAADYVFIFDPWWNAAAETQAIDRVHRIGQKNSVFSYKLITRDTIEEKILQLQQQKKELVESLIESDSADGGGGGKTLKEEDIDFIFSDFSDISDNRIEK